MSATISLLSVFLLFYRNKGNLLGSLVVGLKILLQHRPRRIFPFEEFSVQRVHAIFILYLTKVDGAENNVGKIHVGLLEAIEKIAHGLTKLQIEVRRNDALAGNEPVF